MAKPNPMGATFAERAAAAAGKASFEDPTPKAPEAEDNDTFADRAKPKGKAVEAAENKAVKSTARKTK